MAQSTLFKPRTLEYATVESRSGQLRFVRPEDTPNESNLPFQGRAADSLTGIGDTYESCPSAMNHYSARDGRASPETRSHQPDQSESSFVRTISPENATNETLDRKFYTMMLEIDKRYQKESKLQRHEKIRIEQWSRKLC